MILLKGFLIGLSIAAPVGPIGVLCIRRALNQGRVYGFVSGAGAATADAFYGCVAAFGLTIISHFMMDLRVWIQLIGGLFLLYLGVQSIRSRPNEGNHSAAAEGLLGSYLSTFFLTITNPMTILSFIGVFAGIGFSNEGTAGAGLLVAGVFVGSLFWWFLLSSGVDLLRKWMNSGSMVWINRMSGFVLVLFGIEALYQLIK